jgi:pilus assembly protein Flp/PilA
MTKFLNTLWKDEEGPTAVEYALMLFLVTVAIVAAVGGLKTQVIAAFDSASSAISGG